MNEWLDGLRQIGYMFFARDSAAEMWSLIVVCIFVVFLLYNKISAGFAGKGNRSFVVLTLGILVMALVSIAVQLYWTEDGLVRSLAALAAFFVAVLPLTKAIEKTTYWSSLIVWTVCALVLAAILYLEPFVVNTLSRGVEKGSLLERQKSQADRWDKL